MQQRRLCVSYIFTITSSLIFAVYNQAATSFLPPKAACPPTQAMGMLIFPLFLVESYLSLLSTGSRDECVLVWVCGLKQPPGPEGSIQHSQTLHPLTCSKAFLAFSSHLASPSTAAWGTCRCWTPACLEEERESVSWEEAFVIVGWVSWQKLHRS